MTRPVGLDAWRVWDSYSADFKEQLIVAFCEGARFQWTQMTMDPQWKYVANFNREFARCRYHIAYSNTVSPIVHEEVLKRLGGPPDQGKLI